MVKVINWSKREDLINFNKKLEAVGKFMQEVVPDDLNLIDTNEIYCSLGLIISEESQKITEIIGTYDEFSSALNRKEIE